MLFRLLSCLALMSALPLSHSYQPLDTASQLYSPVHPWDMYPPHRFDQKTKSGIISRHHYSSSTGTSSSSLKELAEHHEAETMMEGIMQSMLSLFNTEPVASTNVAAAPEFFVQTRRGDFVTNNADGLCRRFYVSATNKFEFVEAAAGAPRLFDGKLVLPGLRGPEVVRLVLDNAASTGINVIRFNAFAVDDQYSVLGQNPDGSITVNEGVLKGLDYILDEARKRNIKLLLVFIDYFASYAGSPLQYMEFANAFDTSDITATKAAFYDNTVAQGYYRDYIRLVLNRENTINGRRYKNDPTIFGLDMMNEPRCEDASICTLNTIPNWVQSTYDFIKTIDTKHIITCGTDGFYSYPPNNAVYPNGLNPYNNAGQDARSDFPTICAIVDFCSFNTYPDLWNQENREWVQAWVNGHSQDGIDLQKPVFVKEFGMQPTGNRDTFYRIFYNIVYNAIVDSANSQGGLRGAAYFQAFAKGTQAVWWLLNAGGRFGIFTSSTAYNSVKDFSNKIQALNAQQPGFICPSSTQYNPFTTPLPICQAGFQGPTCTDINECVLGTDACNVNAACTNTAGSYTCQCFAGYTGNGRSCSSTTLLNRIKNKYYTLDTISCINNGGDVAYPTTAPGYIDDPTGSTTPGNCNSFNVTLTECKQACFVAQGCTGFFWDPFQQNCCLKRNECPYVQNSVPGCTGSNGTPITYRCDYPLYTRNSPAPPSGTGRQVCSRGVTYIDKQATLPAGCVPPS